MTNNLDDANIKLGGMFDDDCTYDFSNITEEVIHPDDWIIYKYNDQGYFIKLECLYPCNGLIPKVNSTMSKKAIKIKLI